MCYKVEDGRGDSTNVRLYDFIVLFRYKRSSINKKKNEDS